MLFNRHKTKMVMPTEALPGREQPAFAVPEKHAVLGTLLEPPFPEGYHQQYLYKVPNGYCGLGGTGVSCPVGPGVSADSGGA